MHVRTPTHIKSQRQELLLSSRYVNWIFILLSQLGEHITVPKIKEVKSTMLSQYCGPWTTLLFHGLIWRTHHMLFRVLTLDSTASCTHSQPPSEQIGVGGKEAWLTVYLTSKILSSPSEVTPFDVLKVNLLTKQCFKLPNYVDLRYKSRKGKLLTDYVLVDCQWGKRFS